MENRSLGNSPTRLSTAYYLRLLALLNRVEAAVVEPALVERLRAERDRRRRARSSVG
jgi:Protein of unknown function (DUF3263)